MGRSRESNPDRRSTKQRLSGDSSLMMKDGVHSQNQSIIFLKSTKSYSKFHKPAKPIPNDDPLRPGSVCHFVNF